MGRINQGILGAISGKVGPVVGGSWKGIAYLKSYVIPANPQTVLQTAHRTKFKNFVAAAKSILPTVINNYWEQLDSQMSGFNSFVKRNFDSISSTGILSTTTKILLGDVETLKDLAVTYNTSNGATEITWDGTLSGNGLANDSIFVVCFNTDTNEMIKLSDVEAQRDQETLSLTLPTGLTVGKLRFYAGVHRGADVTLECSDTVNCISTAP